MSSERTTPSSDEPTDLELVLRTHRGHEASARLLWERHAPRLVALASGLCREQGGQASAQDIVQGVFCRLLEAERRDLSQIQDVQAYLARSVRNAVANLIRARERHDRHAVCAAQDASARPEPDPTTTRAGEDLAWAVSRLDPADRELVVLKHAGGLTLDQMALALDQNRSTLAGRYARVIARLRQSLESSPDLTPLPGPAPALTKEGAT